MTGVAVRSRAELLFEKAQGSGLEHVALDMAALDPAADRIAALIRERWPDLVLPFHSLWRRFEAGGHDRFAGLAGTRQWAGVREMGRAAVDMALVSGFVGITAPPDWAFGEGLTAERYHGADGLAIASLAMIAGGVFSGVPRDPLRADAGQLVRIASSEIAAGLQVEPGSNRIDCDGRAEDLRRLGEAVGLREDLFAREDDPRPGGLFDLLFDEGLSKPLPAARILEVLADGLAPVFAGGLELGGIPLGDTHRHPAVTGKGITPDTQGLLPLHTRLQRLVTDLAEPMVWAGIEVVELETLTAQSDPVAIGLLLDTGILSLRTPHEKETSPDTGTAASVELRGLAVALCDRLAEKLRNRLGAGDEELPLVGLLEGGMRYAAGKIALEKRGSAAPVLLFAGADRLL
ncbi:uncharacterized protein DUF1688 [Breoghania corrubedonensis]|uniref:Uncharacterized protein DUF1688 n=2 Tax=Breoghania corrubedonensis TaxID=665038 RepID=A0A2T5VFH7_9HYPH|nr:uncharacterized protein DUF1688 [Breoghania corrubedonensis]